MSHRFEPLHLHISSYLFLAFLAVAAALPAQAQEGVVHYIGNEGFMISRGESVVLIDAVHEFYNEAYKNPSESLLSKIIAGEAPFDSLDYVLVTHSHRDHFSAAKVAELLRSRPDVTLICSGAVAEAVMGEDASREIEAEQIEIHQFDHGRMTTHGDKHIRITAISLHHSIYMIDDPETGERVNKHRHIQNLGFYVDVDGLKFVHLGDGRYSDDTAAALAPLALAEKDVDVLFSSPWTFGSDKPAESLQAAVNPATVILMHINPATIAEVSEYRDEKLPGAIIPEKEMETFVIGKAQ